VIGRHDLTFFVWQLSLFSSTEKGGCWCAGPDADAPVLRSGQPLCVRRGAHSRDQSRTRHAHQDTRQRRASPAKRPSRQGALVLIARGNSAAVRRRGTMTDHPTIPASLSLSPRRRVRKRCLPRIPLRNPSVEPARLAPGQEGGARIIFGTVWPRTRERRVAANITSQTGKRRIHPHRRDLWT
jgi:hypothetical protein